MLDAPFRSAFIYGQAAYCCGDSLALLIIASLLDKEIKIERTASKHGGVLKRFKEERKNDATRFSLERELA
jgi:hypothetical protein